MPAVRLSDSQKAELVQRFRGGEGPQVLAEAFGCSPNTVSRVVKAVLTPQEYAKLKRQRLRRSGADPQPAAPPTPDPLPPDPVLTQPEPVATVAPPAVAPPAVEPPAVAPPTVAPLAVEPPSVEPPTEMPPQERAVQPRPVPQLRRLPGPSGQEATGEDGPAVLAIDDADDFGDDDDDDLLAEDDGGEEAALFVPVPLVEQVDDHTEIRPRPLTAADLPGSAYMLVDKTVELQARPLSEFTELGRLPPDEEQRQALMVFVNPRQAKRLCGRSQRVIKIPDTTVLSRTAPYLLAQGISRLVVEGALFALPGS
jgi:hypothetical protein